MNISERVFLVAGLDFFARQRAIENIKNKVHRDKNASLNTFTFYSKEIDTRTLQEKILTFAFGPDKIVIFKEADKLAAGARKFLFENFSKIISANYIILEIERDYYQLQKDKKIAADNFFKFIFKQAVSFKGGFCAPEVSLEDFKHSIRKRDLSSSLYFLEELLAGGTKSNSLGPLALGVLVREVSCLKDSLERESFFSYLWQADRQIKEKGLDIRLAIETLLVRLL